MDFHEDLPRLGEKEGLKGRKLSKAVESFTWNITVLKVPARSLTRAAQKTQKQMTTDHISREM